MDSFGLHVQARQPAAVDLKRRRPIEGFSRPDIHLVSNLIELVLTVARQVCARGRFHARSHRHPERRVFTRAQNLITEIYKQELLQVRYRTEIASPNYHIYSNVCSTMQRFK